MTIVATARARRTVKAYDPARRIAEADLAQLVDLLRLSPSSANMQPWRFIIAASDQGKARVAKAAEERFPFNLKVIRDASHVVIVACLNELTPEHLAALTAQEEANGRYSTDPEAMKARAHGTRQALVGVHRDMLRDEQAWLEKQTYLNLGQFLLGAAALGIDASAMEGIDTRAIDQEFGLHEQGFHSLCVVALGYADDQADYNARLPKSRLPVEHIVSSV